MPEAQAQGIGAGTEQEQNLALEAPEAKVKVINSGTHLGMRGLAAYGFLVREGERRMRTVALTPATLEGPVEVKEVQVKRK